MPLTHADLKDWCTKLIEETDSFPGFEDSLDLIPDLESLSELPAGTPVLIRGDTDVKIKDDGRIPDDVRLQSLVDTLKYGIEKGWVCILFGHRGRDPQLSLQGIVPHMEKLLANAGLTGIKTAFVPDWMDNSTGEVKTEAQEVISRMPNGSLVVLENTRKYSLETILWKGDMKVIGDHMDQITNYANSVREKLAKVHVNEGFASSNRDLSSTIVPRSMDRVAFGKYIASELRKHVTKTRLAELVIFSGLKIEKLDDLQQILDRQKVKMVIAAGSLAMALKKANAQLSGGDFHLGKAEDPGNFAHVPPKRVEQAKQMLQMGKTNGVEFVLPVDFLLEDGTASDTIPEDGAQMDIGKHTRQLQEDKVGEFIKFHQDKVAAGNGPAYAFHNGVFGKFEEERFAGGTKAFVQQLKRMNDAGVQVYVGGGEGGAALNQYGEESWVTHCFTAGGTILKALGTEPIPYIKALTLCAKK